LKFFAVLRSSFPFSVQAAGKSSTAEYFSVKNLPADNYRRLLDFPAFFGFSATPPTGS